MAKKSNKTEQVLKLITKDEEAIESLVDKEVSKEGSSGNPNEEEKDPIIITAQKIEEALPVLEEPDMNHTQNIQDMTNAAPKYDHLVNLSEILVRERLELVMGKMKVCSCTSCVNDVLALALNSLPTKYVTTDAGKQYSQLEIYKKQYETDVLAALTKACVRVKAAPRHHQEV